MGFKVQSPKWPFKIEDENGGLIKEYQLEIGSESFVKALSEKAEKYAAEAENVKSNYAELLPMIAELVDGILGEGEYVFLFEKLNRNVLVMVELASALVYEGNKIIRDRQKANLSRYID